MSPKYTPEQIIASFWPKVDKTSDPHGCWLWIAGKYENGYGAFRSQGAHRFSWELVHGPVPDGLSVCHTCDVRCCVNQKHMFLGTARDNALDMMSKGRGQSQFREGGVIGESCHATKLTVDDVRRIRALRASGTGLREIAVTFGITQANVSYIALRRGWKHVA